MPGDRAGGRVDRAAPTVCAVLSIQAPGPARRSLPQSRGRRHAAGDQSRGRQHGRLLEGAGAPAARHTVACHTRGAAGPSDPVDRAAGRVTTGRDRRTRRRPSASEPRLGLPAGHPQGRPGARRWRSTCRRRRGSAPILRRPGTRRIMTGRCSGPHVLRGRTILQPGSIRTRSTGYCAATPRRSGSVAATRRTRCGRPSLRRRWRTAPSSRTCRRQPAIAIRTRLSYMTDGATTPRKPRAFCNLLSYVE